MLTRYEAGKASVAFGSNAVIGLGTRWLTYASPEDILHIGDDAAIIESVNTINNITLTETWAGVTITQGAYWIEINPSNLTRAKVKKKNEINSERSRRCTMNVTALGHIWQADLTSQELLNKALGLAVAGAPLPTVWRDIYNNDLPITGIGQLVAIAGAMGLQTQEAYARSWILKSQIEAALTVEELELIVW